MTTTKFKSTRFKFHLLINIFLISGFSLVYGSNKDKKPTAGILSFTSNQTASKEPTSQPSTAALGASTVQSVFNDPLFSQEPFKKANQSGTDASSATELQRLNAVKQAKRDEDAKKITQRLKEIEQKVGEFDELEDLKSTINETTQVALQAPTPMPAGSADSLGRPYPLPTLPAQTATTISTSRGLFTLKAIEDYLDEIIQNGEFRAAHSNGKKMYPKIGEDCGEALTNNAAILAAMFNKQWLERKTLFENHRLESTATFGRLRRLVKANQESYAQGSISQQRTQSALQFLKEIQKNLAASNDLLLQQCAAEEEVLAETGKEILSLHPTPESQPQIQNTRKLTLK
ncbi:hypothetical protein KBB68_00795 [Candidatus Babeliales bacterium]|nr:hypothetical protein [Candidatus Babeliales bacterium]